MVVKSWDANDRSTKTASQGCPSLGSVTMVSHLISLRLHVLIWRIRLS